MEKKQWNLVTKLPRKQRRRKCRSPMIWTEVEEKSQAYPGPRPSQKSYVVKRTVSHLEFKVKRPSVTKARGYIHQSITKRAVRISTPASWNEEYVSGNPETSSGRRRGVKDGPPISYILGIVIEPYDYAESSQAWIVYYLQRKHKFHPRHGSPLHLPNEEPVLGYLKKINERLVMQTSEAPSPAPKRSKVGPLPLVVIREPESGKFQPLPEVQGKGKEKLKGQAGPNPGEHDEGQAGPNPFGVHYAASQPPSSHVVHAGPNLEHMDLEASDTSIQPNLEQMDKEFTTTAYLNVQKNLKLPTEGEVRLEGKPVRAQSGTLSFYKLLDKDLASRSVLVEKVTGRRT
ncbi:hypothetical protein Tco_0555733 [Tanacetum coccineum]